MSLPVLVGLDDTMRRPVKKKALRILLVDDSILARDGLKAILSHEKTMAIVGEARTQAEALAAAHNYHPDVIVMDTQLADGSGIEACQAIRAAHPDISILFLASNDDKKMFRSAILAGAQGYLLKRAGGEAIVKAIKGISVGHSILDSSVTEDFMIWIRQSSLHTKPATQDLLSSHDMQVLFLISSGKVTDEIAKALNLTPSAVKVRLRKIYKQLSISRRSQAASYFAKLDKGRHHGASSPGIQGEIEVTRNRTQT